jgi:hypothetical protein
MSLLSQPVPRTNLRERMDALPVVMGWERYYTLRWFLPSLKRQRPGVYLTAEALPLLWGAP